MTALQQAERDWERWRKNNSFCDDLAYALDDYDLPESETKEGVIRDYQANLDRRLLGLDIMAFVHVRFATHSDQTPDDFEAVIMRLPEVQSGQNAAAKILKELPSEAADALSRLHTSR